MREKVSAGTRVARRTARGPSHQGVAFRARDAVRRTTRTWTDSAMTDECLGTGPHHGSNQNGDWRDPGAA